MRTVLRRLRSHFTATVTRPEHHLDKDDEQYYLASQWQLMFR